MNIDFRDQLTTVEFSFLLTKSNTETFKILKVAYETYVIGKTQVVKWYSGFKIGEISIDDQPCSGHLFTSFQTDDNVKKICGIILDNWQRIIEEFVEKSEITLSSVQQNLTKEVEWERCLQNLFFGHWYHKVTLKKKFQNNKHFPEGESLCYRYGTETKQYKKTQNSPRSIIIQT